MTNWKIIGFFLTVALFFMVLLQIQGRQLVTPQSPLGILSLEFSFQSNSAQKIVDAWMHSLRGAFRINMLLDFLFIPFYGLFLYSTCGYFSVHYRPGLAQSAGVLLAFGSLLAMLFDITENFAMIYAVHCNATAISSSLTTTMATLKFLLIGMALIYCLVSALATPFRK